MKTDSLNQTLSESLNNPESWFKQAEQQFLVAEKIAPNIPTRALTESELQLRVGYLKTTTLLLALSIENALKAIKASRSEYKLDEKGRLGNLTGGGKSGHILNILANEAGLTLRPSQVNLLERLTEIGVWAGKYHAPKSEKEFENSNIKDPRSLTLPSDLTVTKEILLECAKISGVISILN